jgi:hypothetical protein
VGIMTFSPEIAILGIEKMDLYCIYQCPGYSSKKKIFIIKKIFGLCG